MPADGIIALQMGKKGNLGNKLFQYAYLRNLQRHLPPSVIYGADMPELGVTSPDYVGSGLAARLSGGHVYPFETVAQAILQNDIRCLHFGAFVQRLEYLGPPEAARALFTLPKARDDDRFAALTSDRHITCVVRAEEILQAVHQDYPPTPIAFFRAAVADSGRIPVLVGQTGSSFYADALRRLFPEAVVYDHISPVEDFRFIVNSTNIAVAVSTFAWMAAYLSPSARRIYLPKFGFLNPDQRPQIDLLPRGDARYRLAAFEVMKWTGEDSQRAYVLDAALPVSFQAS